MNRKKKNDRLRLVPDGITANHASIAVDRFKKNKFNGQVTTMIRDVVMQAKRAAKR